MTSELEAFMLRVLAIFNKMDNHDDLWWRTDGVHAPVKFFAKCSDFFWWGTSDLEEITPENIDQLEQAVADIRTLENSSQTQMWGSKLDHWAPQLFVARLRGMRPQGAYYKHIDEQLWSLFDACGPERKAGLGNPREHP